MILEVPFHPQEHAHTCGPACLRMMLDYYGTRLAEAELVQRCDTTLFGTTRPHMVLAALDLGFSARLALELSLSDMREWLRQGRPIVAIVHPALLRPGDRGFTHAIVVVGHEDEILIYHDPGCGPAQRVGSDAFREASRFHGGRAVLIWKP